MHTVPKRSFTPMLLGLLLLAQFTPCAARAQGNLGAGRADLSVTLRNGWVDVLVANRGPGDLPEHFRMSRAQIGAELKFLFFRDGRRCLTCRFKAEFDHVDAVARSSGNGPILASEAVGFGVFEAELARMYGLQPGCYAFFAQFDAGRGAGRRRIISNVASMCGKREQAPFERLHVR